MCNVFFGGVLNFVMCTVLWCAVWHDDKNGTFHFQFRFLLVTFLASSFSFCIFIHIIVSVCILGWIPARALGHFADPSPSLSPVRFSSALILLYQKICGTHHFSFIHLFISSISLIPEMGRIISSRHPSSPHLLSHSTSPSKYLYRTFSFFSHPLIAQLIFSSSTFITTSLVFSLFQKVVLKTWASSCRGPVLCTLNIPAVYVIHRSSFSRNSSSHTFPYFSSSFRLLHWSICPFWRTSVRRGVEVFVGVGPTLWGDVHTRDSVDGDV